MPDAAIPAPDATASAEPFQQAIEAILAEAERHAAWLSELEAETAAARARRDQLAVSLEGLFRALGPHAARAYAARLSAIAQPAPDRPQGKPAPDGRLAFIRRLLAGWPGETITARELTEALRKNGFEVRRTYAFKPLTAMAKTGLLVQTGPARYRIVRTHPEMMVSGEMGSEANPQTNAPVQTCQNAPGDVELPTQGACR